MKKHFFVAFFLCLSLIVYALPVLSAYSSGDPYETDFEDIENPTADDLLTVSEPTIDDFQRLSSYEQQEYLLMEYNSEFAAEFLAYSDFSEAEDRIIAEKYYSEDPEHINNDPEKFTKYMEQEGIDITLIGPINDYDEKGNLYGNNQIINLNNFKNSPASDEYAIVISDDGTIELFKKNGQESTAFTGNLQADNTGKFSLKEGTINNYNIKGAKQLEFDENGEISGGSVTYYDGITFAEQTPIDTSYKGSMIHFEDAKIISVKPSTVLYVYGSATFQDYNTIEGKLTIPDNTLLVINNVLFAARGDDVELRFPKSTVEEEHVTYAKISDDEILLNGNSITVLFNSKDFVEGRTEDLHKADAVVKPISGQVSISKEDGRVTVVGKEMTFQFGEEVYLAEEGKLYKTVAKETPQGKVQKKGEIIDESLFSKLGTESGTAAPIDVKLEPEGGVALSLENEYTAIMGEETAGAEEEKPTVVGTAIQGTEIATAYLTGDAEEIQERIDQINENLIKGVGISEDDQEFLVALYSGISAGGYVKAGPNAGTALAHYFTGDGEQLDVDSEMFEESETAQNAMAEITLEIKKHQDAGYTTGTVKSGSCDCVHEKVVIKVEGVVKIVDNTEGVITSGKDSDTELYYTNHNYYLDATWEKTPEGDTKIVWSVDDLYDFKGYSAREAILLPVLGTDEVINLPDGVAKAMATDLNLAKPFNVHAEWETSLEEFED